MILYNHIHEFFLVVVCNISQRSAKIIAESISHISIKIAWCVTTECDLCGMLGTTPYEGMNKFMALNIFKKKGSGKHAADDSVDEQIRAAGIAIDPMGDDVVYMDPMDPDANPVKTGKDKRGKRAKARRKDEALSSVLTESEPGAAVDVMRQIERFTLPKEVAPNGGYVVMVLPTADPSFGGLSRKQNKDKDKGLIINLMQAGDIEIVITPELLDDDALGIIPEHDTLERMDEFTILRDARFLWGVAVTNQEDGSLTVFTVPGRREEDADGKLFNAVAEVARGDLDITDVIDMQLVRCMIDIFNHDAEGYGADGVITAIDLVMEAYGVRRAQDKLPTSDEYTNILYDSFPLIDPEYDPEAAEAESEFDEEDEVVADNTAVAGVVGSEDTADSETVVDTEALADEDVVAQPQKVVDDIDPSVDDEVGAEVEAETQAESIEAEDTDKKEENTENEDRAGKVDNAAVQPVPAEPIDVEALVKQITQEIRENSVTTVPEGLSQADMDELIARQTDFLLQNGLIGGAATGPDQRIINQLGHSIEQSTDDLDGAVTRNFLDDDLGLQLDTSMFDNTVYGQLPQLTLPDFTKSSQTPWLNEQLEALVRNINSELEADYMRRREILRKDYVKMVTTDIEMISREVSIKNRNSRYFPMQEMADQERDTMLRRQEQRVSQRRQEIQKEYDERRRTYIERRLDELGAEFDRENRGDLDHALRTALTDMQSQTESIYNAEIAHMNWKRKEDAQQRYRLSQYHALSFMQPAIDEMYADEAETVRSAAQRVEDYIKSMAQDDIRHGEVIREQFLRDNRAEEIREDAERQVREAREKADVEISRISDAMDKLRTEHERFIADLNRDNAERVAHAERQIEAVRAERESDREHLETVRQRYEEKALEREQDAEERVKQAQADLDAYVAAQKSDNTTMIIVMVVLSIVMVAAGVALGNLVF